MTEQRSKGEADDRNGPTEGRRARPAAPHPAGQEPSGTRGVHAGCPAQGAPTEGQRRRRCAGNLYPRPMAASFAISWRPGGRVDTRLGPAITPPCCTPRTRWRHLRHGRGRGIFFGPGCRGTLRLGLPTTHQSEIGQPYPARASATLFHRHRSSLSGLGGQLPTICRPRTIARPTVSWCAGDAPFRETAEAITAAQEAAILAVEVEVAALQAFAAARKKSALCLAHVTDQMELVEGNFEHDAVDGQK